MAIMMPAIAMAQNWTEYSPKDKSKRQDVRNLLFLGQEQMPDTYRRLDHLFAIRTIKRGHIVFPLPMSASHITIGYKLNGNTIEVEDFMKRNAVVGMLLIKDGKIIIERYAQGNSKTTRWPSWSVAKSITSTLVGAAVQDGYIGSIDDPVTKYLPQLKESAYEGSTVRELLQMSSGVKFNEKYSDRNSDFGRLMRCYYDKRPGCVLALAKTLPKETSAGSKFVYSTLDATLVGDIVMAATHKNLSDYLSEKIWSPLGMERNAWWVLESRNGQEFGGALMAATLRDYGRFGQFMLGGGTIGKNQVLPSYWISEATHPYPGSVQVYYGNLDPGDPQGYGYYWWLFPPGKKTSPNQEEAYEALGIFGQHIYVNSQEKIVAVFWCVWPNAWVEDKDNEINDFIEAAVRALH